jgi:ATP-dependent Clp protease adaptor protein ClpS
MRSEFFHQRPMSAPATDVIMCKTPGKGRGGLIGAERVAYPGSWHTIRAYEGGPPMTDTITKPKIEDEIKVERLRLHKVILINDDFTPREFVVTILKAEFRMGEDQALRVMMTAHRRGACVVAVYTKDVAEAKATNATDAGRSKGYPLLFTTEPEE